MKISQSSVNIHKNALYAIAVNSIQIVAAVVLAALLVIEKNNLAIDIFSIVIAVVVTAGAALDIREAMAARRKSDEADMLSDMVAQMDALNRSLRAQRHDFLNHLQVVFSLIEMEEQKEAADYIEKVYGDMQSVSRAMRTDNPAINALLRAKLADCEAAGVLTEMDVSGSWRELPMPAWEMCRVFSNLMDNAIDALEDTADKRLRILLREDLRELEAISGELALLAREGIETRSQLAAYERALADKSEALQAERRALRNEARRSKAAGSPAPPNPRIAEIASELRGARREARACARIRARSAELPARIAQIEGAEANREERQVEGHGRIERGC